VQTMPAAVGRDPSTAASNVNVKPQAPQNEKSDLPLLPPSAESTNDPGPITTASEAPDRVTPGTENVPYGPNEVQQNGVGKSDILMSLNVPGSKIIESNGLGPKAGPIK